MSCEVAQEKVCQLSKEKSFPEKTGSNFLEETKIKSLKWRTQKRWWCKQKQIDLSYSQQNF